MSARPGRGDERRLHDRGRRASVPRASMLTSSPIATSAARRPSAMPWPSAGEKLPLVTTPTRLPVDQHGLARHGAGGGPRPPGPGGGGRRPRSARRRAAPAPRKSPLSQLTTQPRPACSGVMPGPSSWPCSGRPASRRRVSRAPSPAGSIPAPSTASPELGRAARRAPRSRRRPRRCSRCRRRAHGARPTRTRPTRNAADRGGLGRDGAQPPAGVRALHGDHGPLAGDVDRRRSPQRADHPVGVGGVGHDVEASRRRPTTR